MTTRKTRKPPVDQEPKRAHNEDGTFVADDPSTPEVNEAYQAPHDRIKAKPATRTKRVGAPTVGAQRVIRTSESFSTRVTRHDA